jgi:hypothetical protein
MKTVSWYYIHFIDGDVLLTPYVPKGITGYDDDDDDDDDDDIHFICDSFFFIR